MLCAAMLVLFALSTQAQREELATAQLADAKSNGELVEIQLDKVVDRLVDKMLERVAKVWPPQRFMFSSASRGVGGSISPLDRPCPNRDAKHRRGMNPVGSSQLSPFHAKSLKCRAINLLTASIVRLNFVGNLVHNLAHPIRPQSKARLNGLKSRAQPATIPYYYEVLQVPQNADESQIKDAYRKLVKVLHPDVNKDPDADEKFKTLCAAFEVISDPEQRRKYDHEERQRLQKPRDILEYDFDSPFYTMFKKYTDPLAVFDQFMAASDEGRTGKFVSAPGEGGDQRRFMNIAFEDAAFGCTKTFKLTRTSACLGCSGSGTQNVTWVKRCIKCKGTGQLVTVRNTILGWQEDINTCSVCEGVGKKKPLCGACNGTGFYRENKTFVEKLPAGVNDGFELRIKGEGDVGKKRGPKGDVVVSFLLDDHPTYPELRLDGTDVRSETTISYFEAILGMKATANTVDGPVEFEIPAGTQPNAIIALENRGAGKRDEPEARGNHLVKVLVDIPRMLTEEELSKNVDAMEVHSFS